MSKFTLPIAFQRIRTMLRYAVHWKDCTYIVDAGNPWIRKEPKITDYFDSGSWIKNHQPQIPLLDIETGISCPGACGYIHFCYLVPIIPRALVR